MAVDLVKIVVFKRLSTEEGLKAYETTVEKMAQASYSIVSSVPVVTRPNPLEPGAQFVDGLLVTFEYRAR